MDVNEILDLGPPGTRSLRNACNILWTKLSFDMIPFVDCFGRGMRPLRRLPEERCYCGIIAGISG